MFENSGESLNPQCVGAPFPQARPQPAACYERRAMAMIRAWVGSLLVLSGVTLAADEIVPITGDSTLVSVRATHEGPLERGKPSTVSLAVAPGPGFWLLEDGPLMLDVTGTAADPPKRSLRRADAVDPRAQMPRFELAVMAHKDGAPALGVELTAWLCQARRCRPIVYRNTLPLAVRDDRVH